jgi:hypothetical protein
MLCIYTESGRCLTSEDVKNQRFFNFCFAKILTLKHYSVGQEMGVQLNFVKNFSSDDNGPLMDNMYSCL